jgi:hypothetical protein
LKSERETEIVQMENIILELQLELFVKTTKKKKLSRFNLYFINRRAARDEAEFKRKKYQQSGSTTPPKTYSDNQKANSPPTPTNNRTDM